VLVDQILELFSLEICVTEDGDEISKVKVFLVTKAIAQYFEILLSLDNPEILKFLLEKLVGEN
jgi:hypothetical protein